MKHNIQDQYLKIIEDVILSNIHKFHYSPIEYSNSNIIKNIIKLLIKKIFNKNNREITIKTKISDNEIENGLIRSSNSFSMIGKKRLKKIIIFLKKIKMIIVKLENKPLSYMKKALMKNKVNISILCLLRKY